MVESTVPPKSYFYTTLVAFFTTLGSTFALLVGAFFLMINSEEGWRTVFYFGAAIAVVGSVARTQLRETPEFLFEKKQQKEKHKTLKELLPSRTTKKVFSVILAWNVYDPFIFILALFI